MGSVNTIDTPVYISQDFAKKKRWGNIVLKISSWVDHFKTNFNGVKSGIHIIQSHFKEKKLGLSCAKLSSNWNWNLVVANG